MIDRLKLVIQSLPEYSVRLLGFVNEQPLEFPLQMMDHSVTKDCVLSRIYRSVFKPVEQLIETPLQQYED